MYIHQKHLFDKYINFDHLLIILLQPLSFKCNCYLTDVTLILFKKQQHINNPLIGNSNNEYSIGHPVFCAEVKEVKEVV